MPGTGSGFSGCGVCTAVAFGAGDAADKETDVASLCWILGAIACMGGCVDFFVSLLSHAISEINPATTITIFKRFNQHSMSAQACPHHIFPPFPWTGSSLLDGSFRRRAAS